MWSSDDNLTEQDANFSWPSEDQLAQLSPEVKLKAIEFWTDDNRGVVSSLRCHLTDGSVSGYF